MLEKQLFYIYAKNKLKLIKYSYFVNKNKNNSETYRINKYRPHQTWWREHCQVEIAAHGFFQFEQLRPIVYLKIFTNLRNYTGMW